LEYGVPVSTSHQGAIDMGALKKGLDKFDIVTPMIAKMFGGTADYGEQADEDEDNAEAIASTNVGRMTKPRVKPRPKSNMLT
jgi:hypothetical protein